MSLETGILWWSTKSVTMGQGVRKLSQIAWRHLWMAPKSKESCLAVIGKSVRVQDSFFSYSCSKTLFSFLFHFCDVRPFVKELVCTDVGRDGKIVGEKFEIIWRDREHQNGIFSKLCPYPLFWDNVKNGHSKDLKFFLIWKKPAFLLFLCPPLNWITDNRISRLV